MSTPFPRFQLQPKEATSLPLPGALWLHFYTRASLGS